MPTEPDKNTASLRGRISKSIDFLYADRLATTNNLLKKDRLIDLILEERQAAQKELASICMHNLHILGNDLQDIGGIKEAAAYYEAELQVKQVLDRLIEGKGEDAN